MAVAIPPSQTEKYPIEAAGAAKVLLVMVAVEPTTVAVVPLVPVKPRSNVLKVHPVTVSAVRLFVALALRLMPREVLINWQLLNVQAPVWNDPVSKKKAWFALPSVLEPVNEQFK